MKRYLVMVLLLGVLLLGISCSTSQMSQDEGPQDGQYYSREYVLDKAEAKLCFYGTKEPLTLYATKLTYTKGGIVSVSGYFVFEFGRFAERRYRYSDEVRTFGGNWEVRDLR